MARMASVSCCLCLALLAAVPAQATILTYSSLIDWQVQAAQSGATIDFSASSPMASWTDPASSTVFSAPGSWVQGIAATPPWYDWGSGPFLRVTDGGFALRIALAAPVSAFATEMMIYRESPPGTYATSQMTVSYGSGAATLGTNLVTTQAKPTRTFFGLVSDDPGVTINWIQLAPATNYAMVDNVRLGSYLAPAPPPPPPPPPPPDPDPEPSPVPEPGSLALGLCGVTLLLLGAIRGRPAGRPRS